MFSRITGVGSYLPERVITNHELASQVETSDEWIFSRTGIRQRHIRHASEKTSDLALHAAKRAIEAANIDSAQIDLIIVATTTPDHIFPSTACILQNKLKLHGFAAFDIQAVCGGFIFALATADMYIKSGMAKCALVVGADTMSDLIDWQDRKTCVLFGDGAGSVILQPDEKTGILSHELRSDGRFSHILRTEATIQGGKIMGDPYLRMDGGAVFRFAVKALTDSALTILQKHQLTTEDIAWFIPHQANIRIIEAIANQLSFPMDKVVVTVASHGNTSAASVPLALDCAIRDGRIQPEDTILLEGIGGGFCWGASLLRL